MPGGTVTAPSASPAILLHQHGIGAFGHRRAGEDANGLAGADGAAQGMAGGSAAHDGERRRAALAKIGKAQCIAIDRGIVVRRHVARGDEGLCENPPDRVFEGDGLDVREREVRGADAVERLRARHQAAAEAKQSSLSCAMGRLELALRQDERGDPRDVVERQVRQGNAGQGRVGRDRDDVGVVRVKQRLAERRTVDFELGEASALNPSTITRSTGV